jgi:protein-tyrosine phosphatase
MIVDLHSHLVPGVDDGAASTDEALLALGALAGEGVEAVVTTPHLLLPYLDSATAVRREMDRHRWAFSALASAAARATSPLPAIGLGQEIWAPDAEAFGLASGAAGLGIGGSDYVLVEFGFELRGDHLDVVKAVLDSGRKIVIAHPERYRFPPGFDPVETAASWQREGALLQINAGSLGGHYLRSNPDSRDLAWAFVEENLASLIASDHHAANRPVSVREAWELLVSRRGTEVATQLMITAPARIRRNEPLDRQAAA